MLLIQTNVRTVYNLQSAECQLHADLNTTNVFPLPLLAIGADLISLPVRYYGYSSPLNVRSTWPVKTLITKKKIAGALILYWALLHYCGLLMLTYLRLWFA